MADKTWLLKIFTGPHAGSEAVLNLGTYVVGRSPDCDIILNDTSLVEQHFRLILTADTIRLNLIATNSPTYVGADQATSDTIELKYFQVVSIGTLCFAIGPAKETWPPIELSTVADSPSAPAPEPPVEGVAPVSSSLKSKMLSSKIEQYLQWWQQSSSQQRGYLLAGIALLSVGLSLLIIVLSAEQINVQSLESQRQHVETLMQEYIVDASVKIVPKAGNRMLVIRGYTDTDEERDAFARALGEASIVADTQIHSSERLRHATSAILEQLLDHEKNSVKVASVPGAPGKMLLLGYVQEDAEWQRVLKIIKDDVTGIQGFEDRVRTLDDTIRVLMQMLNAEHLTDKFNVKPVSGVIYLDARTVLEEQEQQRWLKVHNRFQARFGNHPRLVLGGQEPAKQKIKTLDIDIDVQAISFGNTPYLVMSSGQRYTVGSLLENGYIVEEINRTFVLLYKDGQLARYYFKKD